MSKLNLLTFFCLLFFGNIFSQLKIKGVVIDQNNKPIELAEVILLSIDSTAIKNEFTDQNGLFLIEEIKGNYILEIRQIGTILFSQKLVLENQLDLGIIKVESLIRLEEVVVTPTKKLMERKVDRLVFNVENSISAIGSDAIDVLNVTPSVKIQSDVISIIGKSGVEVMINNKKTGLSGDELLAYLKSIRSENISKIEVITNPSVKYDSEGNSGIINIVLKKNGKLGLSGATTSSVSKAKFWNFNNGLNLNFQNEQFKISWNNNLSNFKNQSLENNKIETPTQVLENDSKRVFSGSNLSSNLSLDYKLSDNSNLGFVYNIVKRNIIGNGETSSLIQNFSTQQIASFSRNDANGIVNSFNLYYTYNLDKSGKKLSLEGNYISNRIENNVVNTSDSSTYSSLFNTIDNNFRIQSAQVDFQLPNKFCQIETGAKITQTNSNSDTNYTENTTTLDNNSFEIDEKIAALYITSSKEINAKWTTSIGFRYEHTNLNVLPQNSDEVKNIYDNLFPTASLLYNQNDTTSWSLNYNSRISRPNYNDLNPYQFYFNSYSYTTGNPYLKASISHNIEFSFTRNNLNITFYGSRLLNGSGIIARIDNDIQVNRNENYFNENSIGFNASYSYTLLKVWEIDFYLDGHYEKATSTILEPSSFEGWNGYFSINNSLILNKSKTFLLYANFWQTPKNRTDYRDVNSNANFSTGLRYSMLNKNLQMSLSVRDLFRQEIKSGTFVIENGTNFYRNYYDARRLTLSLNYKFGSNKVKGNQKNISSDEKERTIKE